MVNSKPSSRNFTTVRKSTKISSVRYGVLYLLLSFLMVSCDQINIFSRPHVATVNGSKIYLDEYQSCLDKKILMVPREYLSQPDDMKAFEQEVLDGMITEKIMQLRAKELNISVSDTEVENKIKEIRKDYGEDFASLFSQTNINYEEWKEEFRKELLLQKLVEFDVNSKIKISDEEIEHYFKKHRGHYKSDSRVRVSQIVVRDMATAQSALRRVKEGEDFAKVAADVSISPEASRGGDLGFVTKLVMPEPLDNTIFQMPVDEISDIVQSSYGFHIFKIMEIQHARDRNLADVRDAVISDLRMQKEETAYVAWLDDLKKKAVIKKEDNIKLKKSYK